MFIWGSRHCLFDVPVVVCLEAVLISKIRTVNWLNQNSSKGCLLYGIVYVYETRHEIPCRRKKHDKKHKVLITTAKLNKIPNTECLPR